MNLKYMKFNFLKLQDKMNFHHIIFFLDVPLQ